MNPMSYGGYVWPYNPETVKVARARNVKEFALPRSGFAVQDSGFAARSVTGSGRFFGEDGAQEFEKLAASFSESGVRMLCLPGMAAFPAVFVSLTMKGQAGPDCTAYEFAFLESTADSEPAEAETVLCTGGETLWDIAYQYGTDADTLLALNPDIEWPNSLEAGTAVATA